MPDYLLQSPAGESARLRLFGLRPRRLETEEEEEEDEEENLQTRITRI